MNVINDDLLRYLANIPHDLDNDLKSFYDECTNKNYPVIRTETLSFIDVLLSIKKPKNVLEIGCCVGFSACLFAKNLADEGKVTTIERYKLMADCARINFRDKGFSDKIELIEKDAIEVLPNLVDKYDLIFLDASKGQYINLLPYCLDLLEVGGIFLADDVLQGGTIAYNIENIDRRNRTIHRRMNEFLKTVSEDKRIKTSILPIGDGLVFGVKIKE